jgi:hypothetical protein
MVLLALCGSLIPVRGIAASAVLASTSVGSKAEDARIAKLLVGTWEVSSSEEEKVSGTITYYADGTGSMVGWQLGRPEIKIRLDFKWELADGLITVFPVKAHIPPGFDPPATPLPPKSVDRVVSISERQLLTEQIDGMDSRKNGTKELLNRAP